MHFSQVLLRALIPFLLIQTVIPQELPFEIPVQLIGFPIIILAVRLSNFLKKLSYAVSPNTYRSRARRDSPGIDIVEVEKKLVQEMGDKVCVYEDVCQEYADKVNSNDNFILDWQDIFRHYEKSPRGKKEFYLLSVFMGDIVKSKELCTLLAKRGRSCQDGQKPKQTLGHQNQTEKHSPGDHHNLHHHQSPIHHSQPIHQTIQQKPHVHQTVHRHHVEVHYDSEHPAFGQHPPHNIHYQSRRVIHQ